ncbi:MULTISPECIES: polysaccharide biosynthesis C-terminal domain-containing protein [unclassified Haladaptatus]|uniref:oligosaccharide flippase family protein n=1 Tax=unclassified Haladaptatus TaxID=2622732 RepID=UPI00209C60F6|nr:MULTISPECIES: polysaccharide biosynthesis C-terminal domain-containing protein [unclassified Haladaptatus]MCO8246038.1 polysaccharide biosynthesis C-terminal domain-containing protein [Haladaptatus sp. AB643]MCO8254341.1 polysaccharide biosynthesis C-terminal domain-containing protein [Haladaptatus sp. AB618]
MTDISEVNLGGETVKATVAKFAMAASGFVGMILFARLLGPTSLGGFYLLLGVVKIADRPIHGWSIAAKKRFSEYESSESSVVGALVVFVAVWLIVVATVSFALSFQLRKYTGLKNAPMLFFILLASEPLYEPFEKLLQARGQIGLAAWLDAVRSYLTLPLQIFFILSGFGAAGMVFGLAGGTLITIPVVVYFLAVSPTFPSLSILRSLAIYARYSIPSSFFSTIYDRFDVLLLGILLTSSISVGYYEVAAKLTLPSLFVSTAAASGLMTRVSFYRSKRQDITEDIENTLAFASVLAVPIFFGTLVLPKELVVTLYGPEYAPAAPFLIGISAYNVFKSQNAPLTQVINGLDMPERAMYVSGTTLAINIAIGVLLVLRLGPIGVVIATLIAELARYILLSLIIRKYIPGMNLIPRTIWQQFGSGVIMSMAVLVIHQMVPIRSWFGLTIHLVTGSGIYAISLIIMSDLFRSTIGSVLRGSQIEQFVPNPVLEW